MTSAARLNSAFSAAAISGALLPRTVNWWARMTGLLFTLNLIGIVRLPLNAISCPVGVRRFPELKTVRSALPSVRVVIDTEMRTVCPTWRSAVEADQLAWYLPSLSSRRSWPLPALVLVKLASGMQEPPLTRQTLTVSREVRDGSNLLRSMAPAWFSGDRKVKAVSALGMGTLCVTRVASGVATGPEAMDGV